MLPSVSLTGPPSAETDRTGGNAVESSVTSGMASLSTTGRSWDCQDLETVWFTIRPQRMPRNFPCIVVGVVYHPPGAKDRLMLDHIIGCVDHITLQHPNAGVIICGDFNQLKDSYLKSSCQLKQVVTSPTRLAGNVGQGVHQHGCPLCRYQRTPPCREIRPPSGAVQGHPRGHLQASCM